MNQPVVLIVDDNRHNLQVLLSCLQQANYKVLIAEDGRSALKRVVHQPDIILLDVVMPEMDGFAVCRRLKSNAVTRDIPVIFTTAVDDIASKVRGFEVGGADYITKPINETELLARLETHLTLREMHAALQNQAKQLEQAVQSRTAELQAEIARRETEQQERTHLYNLVKQQSKNLHTITEAFVESQQQKQLDLADNLDQHVLHNLDMLVENLRLITQLTQAPSIPEAALAMIAVHADNSLELLTRIQSRVKSVASKLTEKSKPPAQSLPLLLLSDREQEVLKLVIAGKTSYEIAAILSISHSTVRTYRSRMMQKLGISDIPSLIKLALQHNLVD